MEVRPGYKQSELGAIPAEWAVLRLGELAHMASGGTPPSSVSTFYGGDIPWVSISDMTKAGKTLTSTERTLTPLGLANSPAREFPAGTVLYAMYASIGECSIAAVPVSTSQAILGIKTTAQLHSEYLYYWLESSKLSVKTHGQQGTQANLNKGIVQDFRLIVPGYVEQRMIATALSDADALLGGLEELITKKRDLKQAAMQELLTGQTRLPGFNASWSVKRLGELGAFLKGSGVKKGESRSGELPCVRYGEIYTHHDDYVKTFNSWISSAVADTATALHCGDILFAGSGETKAEIGKCVAFVDNLEAYAGGDIIILRPTGGHSLFLGYLLNSPALASEKSSRGQGDAVVHISANALASLPVLLPTVDEQSAIATVLADMDVELLALEARRDKTRALKQAMMYELLTGRTRLAHAGGAYA